jgi:uroporphyrinogen-III synthase
MDVRRDLDAAQPLPLRERSVLVTRPAHQADELADLLEAAGARVLRIPLIEILPPERWDACDEAIANISRYDAIALTSANAASSFLSRAAERGRINAAWDAIPVYVVGSKTGRAVEKYGLRCIAAPDADDAAGLADYLVKQHGGGTRFLFPKGNLTRTTLIDALTNAGLAIDAVDVYRTVAAETLSPLDSALFHGERPVDVVTLFSPSGVDAFFDAAGVDMHGDCVFAAIGQTTAEAARRRGAALVIVADAPTSEALVGAIVRFFIAREATLAPLHS